MTIPLSTQLSAPSPVEPQIDEHDLAVAEAIVQGKSLEEAGVNTSFLLKVASTPGLALLYQKARELSSYALEEEALGRLRAAVTAGTANNTQLRAIDLLVQQLRWSSVKRNPNIFSEKAAINVTVPIQINTSLDLGTAEATGGTKEFPNIYEVAAVLPKEVPIEDVKDHLPLPSPPPLDDYDRPAYEATPSAKEIEGESAAPRGLRGATEVESELIERGISTTACRKEPEVVRQPTGRRTRPKKGEGKRVAPRLQSQEEGRA